MFKKLLAFINQPTRFGEIMRFVIVGGIATVIDYLFMGITLYIFNPSIYPSFFNVFFGAEPETIAKVVGTGVGFLFGLGTNYILSIAFVFNEKGNSKTASGAFLFIVLSSIGLGIHLVGMYLLSDLARIDEWVVKTILTIVVLVFNYFTRKYFIFKKDKSPATSQEPNENSNDNLKQANTDND